MKTVYVVHCIDTEGPLYESVEATFERLNSIFHFNLEPSHDLLHRLQRGEMDLGGLETAVQRVVAPRLLTYYDTWEKLDSMLIDALSSKFRSEVRDSYGGGWVYNWFCVDHVDYQLNPRRRQIGYHNIFDHYQRLLNETGSAQDGIHFHYHPHPFQRHAHLCATHWWANSESLGQIISRRVIERNWFPAANRPGFHVIRPDSHWFLEQHIPFDFSNQACAETEEDKAQFRTEVGRWGDWHRAPANWQPYHPSHDDYQTPGNCRRWIARCLNVGTRYRLLTEKDVREAFREANAGKPVVLGITNHDFRDLRVDVRAVGQLLVRVAREFPEVTFRFSEAVTAMRQALGLLSEDRFDLKLDLVRTGNGSHVLRVESVGPTFGPQPWLALKTAAGNFHYDNFDILKPFHRWQYVFDEETYPIDSLSAVGVAANNAAGITSVKGLDPHTGKISQHLWNASVTELQDGFSAPRARQCA
jgi:hypothetical protein